MAYSAVLHVVALALIVFGLPVFLRDRAIMPAPSVPIEIVTIAQLTAAPATRSRPQPPQPEPPKAAEQPTPPAPAETIKPETKPEPAKKPDVAAKPPDERPAPPKPREKPAPPLLAEKKPSPKEDPLQSIFKNVEQLKKRASNQPQDPEAPKKQLPVENVVNRAQTLTISEVDLVRRQLERCWNVPAGARDAENLVVDVWVAVNPDGTVREARVLNQRRMASDPFFRAAAESARRAVLNPKCSPLKLPPEKYDEWKEMTIGFDPKDMYGT